MPEQPRKPFWIDLHDGRQEGYRYGETHARSLTFEYEGRSIRLICPELTAPSAVRVVAAKEVLLILLGELVAQDDEDEDAEEGYGAVMVARRLPHSNDTYWLLVWHLLFPETLEYSGCLERGSEPPAESTEGC
jgi:hypothetical protein